MDEEMPLLGHFGRSLSNLFTQCASPARVIVLSIDDITNGDGEFLLDGNKRGGPVAMLKWAKGSKHGGHGPGNGSAARVSLADLRRASAKLLRRKDSSSTKSKNNQSIHNDSPTTSGCKIGATISSTASADGSCSPPPPLVPPRGSSACNSTYGGSVIVRTPTPASGHSAGVIKQATVRRMSTLRQARSASPVEIRGQHKRPGSSSSSCTTSSSCSSSNGGRARRRPMDTAGDNNSSLYMQLDKIPVAVQQTSSSSSSFMTAANMKRKALEDISNQAYRHIIHSLQDELAQMSEAEAEAEAESESADETRTLAEATLLPMNQMEIMQSSTGVAIRNHSRQGSMAEMETPAGQQHHNIQDGVASFTSQPPSGDLHRPRAVRHPSPTCEPTDLLDLSNLNGRNGLPTPPMPGCHPFNGTSSPLKKACHTSTGQHLHQYCPARSLSHGLPVNSGCSDSIGHQLKKSRANKQVTFQTEARLIGETITLPVVFESDQEDSISLHPSADSETEPLMPGFVNVPCSRRGFCLELDSTSLPEVAKLDDSCAEEPTDQVDHCPVRRVTSPDGYDWQPSYVNLEDTEIAPVLLASSRPADDSSDFWKPRSVASGQQQQQGQIEPNQPVYDAPTNSKADDNPLLLEFPGFRYAIQLPGNVLERRSISNGSSGSDTQDSGVAEMAQALSMSRAASASPQLAASSQSLAEDMLLPVQPFVYNTLPRTDNKRSQYYNCWNPAPQPPQQQLQIPCPSNMYSTTDPHFLSALASPYFSRRVPEESPSPPTSSSAGLMANVDTQDSSWSSDHLYCNMASVDPLPSLPPRISRRCHSLLALTRTTVSEDADYENLNMPSQPSQPGQPAMAIKARLNISHSRSRSLRHSGDFTSPFGWMIPPFQQPQTPKTKEVETKSEETERSSRPVSARKQQLMYERAHRLDLMLNDASVNDCSEMYEPSDWSMEAMLSDTVRDMENLSFADQHCQNCQHCCCTTARQPPQCRCQLVIVNHSPSIAGSVCQCRKKKSSWPSKVRENAATQTEQNNAASPLARTAAAENPLYMAYNDLTKIDDLDRSAVVKNASGHPAVSEDYTSDGCETWNSHKALYARLQAAKQSRESTQETPVKKRKGRQSKATTTPSGSRIWRHDGQSVSTPQKNRREGGRRRQSRRRGNSVNTTANSSKMDRTALSTRSTYSTRGTGRRKSCRRPKAADVLHGKGQLQLAIYLNSGLLTIHVQSARYLKSTNGRPCNSYVKVSLIPDSPEQTFCRTTLVKNDSNPWYDQKFSFEFLSADLYKRLFISVWHRDAKKNRSDFMGCMSFSVSHVIRKDASGWYRLLNGNIGRQRHFAVKKQIDLNNSTIVPTDPDMEEDLVVVDDSDLEGQESDTRIPSSGMPDTGPSVRPTETKGKTPYTTTMNLKRGPKGYGFSVTWTHPPRIERVEPGLAADLAGMRVADYIVFVGSHNVVKMDEEQVLQLIQSAGDTLTLEIYRKNGNKPSGCGSITSEQLTELQSSLQQQQQQQSNPVNHSRSSSSCASSTVGRHHQSSSSTMTSTAASSASRRIVENASHANPTINGGHVRHPTNTTAPILLLGASLANAAPLKVAFNKSIGGGVLV